MILLFGGLVENANKNINKWSQNHMYVYVYIYLDTLYHHRQEKQGISSLKIRAILDEYQL